MRSTVNKPFTIPAMGVVKGGRLDRWRFHFVCFSVECMALKIICRWTPLAWPFFREFAVDHTYFGTLRPVVGERAKRLPTAPLISTAYRAVGVDLPSDHWLIDSKLTLRARVKRSHQLTNRRP